MSLPILLTMDHGCVLSGPSMTPPSPDAVAINGDSSVSPGAIWLQPSGIWAGIFLAGSEAFGPIGGSPGATFNYHWSWFLESHLRTDEEAAGGSDNLVLAADFASPLIYVETGIPSGPGAQFVTHTFPGVTAGQLFTQTLVGIVPFPTVVCGSPPAGQVGVPYTHTFPVTTIPAFDPWQIRATGIPSGLSIPFYNSSTMSGTPTAAGTYSMVIEVINPVNDSIRYPLYPTLQRATCTIVIAPAPAVSQLENYFDPSMASKSSLWPYKWDADTHQWVQDKDQWDQAGHYSNMFA